MSKVSGYLKFALVVGVLLYFFGDRLTSFNDSYEEQFCKSYNQWNKYAWAVRNNDTSLDSNGNWQSLEIDEYSKLQELVAQNDPYLTTQLSKYADQWFRDGLSGDTANGQVMAAMLIGECAKMGVEIDRDYLQD
jgi:hypothetical protein